MLLNEKHANWLLNCAAVLVGIAIPSLFFGRAVIGICLGLAFILVLIELPHRKTFEGLRQHIPSPFAALVFCVIAATALNIPFSFQVDLSFEAWGRSWLLLFLISYMVFGLRDKLDLIFKSLSMALMVTLLLTIVREEFFHLVPSKPVLNGFLLAIPLSLYLAIHYKHMVWKLLATGNFGLFFWFAITRPAKASVAGVIIMVIAAVLLFSLSRFRLRTAILSTIVVFGAIALGLFFWLPDSMNASSANNQGLTQIPVWALDLHRQLIWSFSLDLIAESPWIGFGINASNYHPQAAQTIGDYFGGQFSHIPDISNALVLPSHPHNWMIEMLLDAGWVGFFPVLVLVSFTFIRSIMAFWHNKNTALLGFIIVNVGYWGTGLLNFSFWSVWWQVTYFVSAAVFFCLYLKQREAA
ncbi:MAG: O-antigen ligase family protein [Methylocystaceae bacterium]|nr:O-antigen ligase family protein [Methylocystaceae bacterium]